jgi:hypothetical protein
LLSQIVGSKIILNFVFRVKELEPDAVWVIDDTGAPDITEEGFRVLELIEAERQEQIRSGGQQQQESRARTS